MFEPFSRGYYLGRLYVEPRDAGPAAMCHSQHERVNEQLYGDGESRRTDHPLVMKLRSRHFPVEASPAVPAGRLAVPRDVLDDESIRNPPTLTEVLLAKADRAAQLLRVTNGEPRGDGAADGIGRDGSTGI